MAVAARTSSRRLKDGPERAWNEASLSELESLSRRESASAAVLRRSGQYSTAKLNPRTLLSH